MVHRPVWLRVFSLFVAFTLVAGFSFAPSGSLQADWSPDDSPAGAADTVRTSHRLIVELKSPPLATWAATASGASFPNGALNVQSPVAQNYITLLRDEQNQFVSSLQATVPGASISTFINEQGVAEPAAYQIVFNGLAVDPGPTSTAAAQRALLQVPGVKAVYRDYAYHTTLYTSTNLINAPALYGNPVIGGRGNAGAGIKVASVDGGIHKDAPMFSGAGYSYPPDFPPTGLGLTENNNGKIIASRAYFRSWDPPKPGEMTPWPGATGTSHGVHTSGIAAGNVVTATYLGLTIPNVGGVANHAWLMSYRVFYDSVTGDGSFYTAEGIAALEDVVADGADVVNNSWGGGPASIGGDFDALDTALINAHNAGVFVSMSTGNAGPGFGTSDHPSDDYISVAATTSGGTIAAGRLHVSAPEPISDTLQNVFFAAASFGEVLPIAETFTHTFAAAAVIDPTNVEGCDPWPAGTFTGQAAVISRGACEFGVKVLNAEEAGAEFVVVYNNAGEELISMGPGVVGDQVTIPSVFVGQAAGEGMVAWYDEHGAASELTIDTTGFQVGNTPDVVIDFSSRGPGVGNTLKPDIAAPGVNILSQGYTPGATGEARHLGFGQVSGTSMASPHVAGAAALLRQIHPDWSNAYIKSALMSTSKYLEIYTEEGVPAQPLDMGAGRLDLTHAADPGLIFNPPSLGFGLVPSGTVESIQVTLTSVASAAETYNLSTLYTGAGFTATTALPGFTVSPSVVTLAPGASAVVTVTIDTAASAGLGENQGFIVVDGSTHDGHLPAWARVTHANPLADILLIDNDGSSSLALPDYRDYYTGALDALEYTYDIHDADAEAGSEITLPDLVTLLAYDAIVYFTGDNFQPDGTFTVPTPLTALDMDRLTEYANNGGKIIAMGQDLASLLGSTEPDTASFFYGSVLGGEYLQDSVTDVLTPTLPIIPHPEAPPAFQDLFIDVSDAGDGAVNQLFIDEIVPHPNVDPNDPTSLVHYQALLKYPGPFNLEDGVVAMAHRDQPTLERPGTSYLGRTIYTTFGLEGVNNGLDSTERDELLGRLLDWAMDEPEVTITNTTPPNPSNLSTFEAAVSSTLTTTTGISYRWDFGDGSGFVGPYESAVVSHTYAVCGTYAVRVEATDSFGNKAIGTLAAQVGECTSHILYFPIIAH